MSEESAGKRKIDWEAIEREYRLGVMTLRSLGSAYGVTDAAICKRAKRDGWERDLSARVAARASELVRKEEVRKKVCELRTASEKDEVEASAEALKDVLLGHRTDIKKAREVVKALFQRLEGVAGADDADIQALIAAVGQNDPAGAKGLAKILGLPSLVGSVKGLTDSLKTVIGLERQAFGLKDGAEAPTSGDGGVSSAMSAMERDALRDFLAARVPTA